MKDAVKRGIELALTKFSNVPDKAIIYARYLCSKYGMSGEVFVTAYAIYSQIEEGSYTDDDLYKIENNHLEEYNFAQNMYKVERTDIEIKVVRIPNVPNSNSKSN